MERKRRNNVLIVLLMSIGFAAFSTMDSVIVVNNGNVDALVDEVMWIKDDGTLNNLYNVSSIIYTYSFPN